MQGFWRISVRIGLGEFECLLSLDVSQNIRLFSLDMVIPVWKHVLGPQLRQRFNLVSGSMADQLRQLAAFGLNKDHLDAVYRNEMSHRMYVDKWLKSIDDDTIVAQRQNPERGQAGSGELEAPHQEDRKPEAREGPSTLPPSAQSPSGTQC
jgi:hypothetical protein